MGQNTRYGYKLDQTGQQTQDLLDVINNKVDKVEGKGLSANDFTDADKGKLDGIQAGAEANVQANWSQNDPSADDYVRNRTHYEETSTIRIDNALLAWSGSTSQNLDFWFHGTNVHIPRTSTGWGLTWQGGELFIDDNGFGYELGVYNGEGWSINPFDPSYDQQPYPLNVDVVIASGTTVHKLDNKFLDMDLTPTAQSDKPVMSGGVASAISSFITRSVNDLANYYLKSETYTKAEVESLIGAIQHFHYEIYPNLESVTHLANNILYLIGPTGSGTDKYEEYVYDSTKTNPWVKIGDTSIDLSGYVTTEALNTALANYVTSTALATALSAKQNTLVSGENIKTVNGQSILGSGNISIEGASDAVKYTSQSLTDAQKGQARTNIGAASDSEVSQLRSEVVLKDNDSEAILNDDTDRVYIADQDENAILKIDKDGLHTTDIDVNRLNNINNGQYNEIFYLVDVEGNVIVKVDGEGIHTVSIDSTNILKNSLSGKVMATYGDSITAVNNGDFSYPFTPNLYNWGNEVAKFFSFSKNYGRGIGSTCFKYRDHGGQVAWVDSATGNYVNRNDSYTYDNYEGHVTIPDGCTAIRGDGCSWLRLTSMFPASIRSTIDVIMVMFHNDFHYDMDTDVTWIPNDTTDPEWAASDEYLALGGDYNISSVKGGIASVVMKLQALMPQATIILSTPIGGVYSTAGVNTGDFNNSETEKMKKLADVVMDVAQRMSTPCINVYGTCGINTLNRTTYISDTIHPYTVAGRKKIGAAVASGLSHQIIL